MAEHDRIQELLEIIEAAKAGDEVAFEKLYDEFYEPILRFLAFRVPSAEDAEDLAQSVFLRFYKNLSGWQYQGYSPLAYVFTIARSVVADYYRKNKIKKLDSSEEILPLLMDNSAGPQQALQSKETVRSITKAISQLPENYQEVVSLRLIKELNYEDIAMIVKKSEVNVRKIYSRGIQKLQSTIAKDLIDE